MRSPTVDTIERLLTEDLVDVATACTLPGLRPMEPKQVYDLFDRGRKDIHGMPVRLEFCRVAGGLRTSRQAVKRFVCALSGATNTPTPTPRKTTRDRQKNNAIKELEAAGML